MIIICNKIVDHINNHRIHHNNTNLNMNRDGTITNLACAVTAATHWSTDQFEFNEGSSEMDARSASRSCRKSNLPSPLRMHQISGAIVTTDSGVKSRRRCATVGPSRSLRLKAGPDASKALTASACEDAIVQYRG